VHYIESFIPGTEPNAFCPIHSPVGSVGGVMGGGGPAPASGTPASTAPAVGAAPAVTAPAEPGPGVMGGVGPSPNPR
jgi:hypothetical protein